MFIKGADVAYPYQPDNYPTKGLSFVMVKATQGNSYVNPHMGPQLRHALSVNAQPGVYHFMQPGDTVASQLEWFKAKSLVYPGWIIGLDWEGLKGVWPSNAAKDAMLDGLKGLYPENKVVLYTNLDGWKNHDTTSKCGDGLWIADPDAPAGSPKVTHPWIFHQYGISNNMDLDVANFSDIDELKHWSGLPVATNPKVDPTKEPGFPVWVYKNPAGPTDRDAWGRLCHAERMLERICAHLGLPTD